MNFALREQLADRILRGHKRTGDGGGARSAVRLQHITVQMDRALAKPGQVKNRPHRATDQTLDFLRAPALLAARGFAVTAGVRGTRQHAVFGRHPAFAAAFFVARHFFFDRCRAQDPGVAKFDQDRSFGMHGVGARDAHWPQFVGGAGVGPQIISHGAILKMKGASARLSPFWRRCAE